MECPTKSIFEKHGYYAVIIYMLNNNFTISEATKVANTLRTEKINKNEENSVVTGPLQYDMVL